MNRFSGDKVKLMKTKYAIIIKRAMFVLMITAF